MKFISPSSGYTLEPVSKEHTNYLKGIAILLIVLHNYYKWVNPITGENEFWFTYGSITKFLVYLRTDPREIFNLFFNFLGFYGVQVFMVISAYGLTRSWMRSQPSYGKFILHRFDKLYPSLFLASLLFIAVTIIRDGRMPNPELLKDLLNQLFLIPGKPTAISGPWWFYSFIFQFYLVFPLMMYIYRKAGVNGLIGMTVFGYLVTILFYDPLRNATLNPYTLFIGHMPEFCFGILLATRDKLKVPYGILLLAAVVLVTGNMFRQLWPFANLSAAILLMSLIQYLWSKRDKMKFFTSLISFTGIVSMYLFAAHGIVRNGFINFANYLSSPWAAMLIGLSFVLFSIGIAFMLMHTENGFRAWVKAGMKPVQRYIRFFGVILPVIGTVAILFMLDRSTSDLLQKEGKVIFSQTDDFELLAPKSRKSANTKYFHSGKQSVQLPPWETYTPVIDAEPKGEDAKGIYEAVVSAWLLSADTGASGHIAVVVSDISTGKILEWKSNFVKGRYFPRGQWFRAEYVYSVPPEYRHEGFRFRAFVWNNGKVMFYADDLHLELRSRR